LACPSAVLCRDSHACQACVGRAFAWPGILHKCYRNSRSATAVVALMQVTHRALGTWHRHVDEYIAPSQTTRQILSDAGLPLQRITVKPHFIDPDPGVGDGGSGYCVFVGRLSEEKGLATVLQSWSLLDQPPKLKVIGDGPLRDLVRQAPPHVEWLGHIPPQKVCDIIGGAALLVFASQGYETFGRVIAEAFAKGTPTIASNIGPSREMIVPGVNGLLFEPGNAIDLAARLKDAFANPAKLQSMRVAARREYEEKYHAHLNYAQLVGIYKRALDLRHHGTKGILRDDELGRWEPVGLASG
jgi:glycosyltransferase involved in cell wall biosynthesis